MGGTLYGMLKTTVYLPEDLDTRLDAESSASGVSKAALIRRAIADLLDNSPNARVSSTLPVFNSGRPLTADEMDDDIHAQIKERSARR